MALFTLQLPTPSESELEGRRLFPIHVLAVVPKSHPLNSKKSIDVTELAPHPLLLLRQSFLTRQLFDSACKMSHVSPRVLLESNTAQALLALVKAEQGIAILPSTVRLDKIRQKVIPIRHNQRPIQLWMSAISGSETLSCACCQNLHRRGVSIYDAGLPGKAPRYSRSGGTTSAADRDCLLAFSVRLGSATTGAPLGSFSRTAGLSDQAGSATIASISNSAPGTASAGTPIAVLAGGAAILR